MNIRDKQILQIALPSIVSNITVPLLGLIDVAIVGHMGSPVFIGAVAVGSMVFNLIYWLFAFLRMGTSGLTSQALGRRDLAEDARIMVRSLTVAMGIALLLIIVQVPMKWVVFCLIAPTPDVLPYASAYYRIVIWGAPAMLGLYSLSGWFIGMQNTRIPMFVSIMQNVVNILVSLVLVYGVGMQIEGVALGTVIAQYAGFFVAIALLLRHYGRVMKRMGTLTQTLRNGLARFFSVNRDIFLRTLCLVAVNFYFTAVGARSGAVVLSVNTVLMQLYLLFSYFMDGFAYAGEALGGRYYGARNVEAFRGMLRRLWLWAMLVILLYTGVYALMGNEIVALLTDEQTVRSAAADYLPWVWLVPIASCMAFIWDGIFIGLTATRGMLLSSFIAAIAFFVTYTGGSHLFPHSANHALWLAQIVYLATRGLVQTEIFRHLLGGFGKKL